LITCAGFFSFIFLREHLSGFVITFLGTTPLIIAVFFGGVQNCLSKAAKYSVFDTTSNMAYIPLDPETKLKGKAAIDGVGSRLGKSGSSFIHQILLMIFSTLSASAPYVAGFLFVVIGFWIHAVRSLGKQLNACIQKDQTDEEMRDSGRQEESIQEEGVKVSELPIATPG
jgi:AAA family ATP:ADP antiporter